MTAEQLNTAIWVAYAFGGGMLVGAHIEAWWLRRSSRDILKQAMTLHLEVADQQIRLLQLEAKYYDALSHGSRGDPGRDAAPTSASQGAAPDTAGATRADAGVLETVEPGVTAGETARRQSWKDTGT